MSALRMLGLFILIVSQADADSDCSAEINPLTLHPPDLVVQYGEVVQVNCTSEVNQTLEWTNKNETVASATKDFVSWTVNASDWDIQAQCRTTGDDGLQCSKDLKITVYQIPEHVLVFPVKGTLQAQEGQEYQLQCDINDVAPVQNLSVRWYKGKTIIKNETNTSNMAKTALTVSFILKRILSRDDDGAEITCVAELDLGPEIPRMPVNDSVTVQVQSPKEMPTPAPKEMVTPVTEEVSTPAPDADSDCSHRLTLDPPVLVVRYGDLPQVNCTSEVNNPTFLEWTNKNESVELVTDDFTASWTVNASDWDIQAQCHILWDDGVECSKDLKTTVYQTPDAVNISQVNPTGALLEGTEYQLQCKITQVAPVQNLTVKWYLPNETIAVRRFDAADGRPQDAVDTINIIANRTDHGAQYRCEAQLDLGPDGPQPPPTKNSSPLTVRVHYAPEFKEGNITEEFDPGSDVQLTCTAEGNPPPTVRWNRINATWGRQSTITIRGATSEHAGLYDCLATNEVGNVTRTTTLKMRGGQELGIVSAPKGPPPATKEMITPATKEMTIPAKEMTTPATKEMTTPATKEMTTPAIKEMTTPATKDMATPATKEMTTPTKEMTIPAPGGLAYNYWLWIIPPIILSMIIICLICCYHRRNRGEYDFKHIPPSSMPMQPLLSNGSNSYKA